MIVVGTAGHIDHGKSSIVKRLTGTDPDRLPEEKARGMTIDLGFAFYRTISGEDIAFVDVPGHERFVRNMIAGAGGIDAVMLVIAADDGWMPQSQEHFDILKLLRIESGFIVINKSDLVESDWLELLRQEIRGKVQGSFLTESPIVSVSAVSGAGFDDLQAELDRLAATLRSRKDIGKARLYIDRSFVQQGIGGVVTGTLRGGSLAVGQTVSMWPAMIAGKVRTLQSKGVDTTQVAPGSRTAVSLTGVERELLVRGGVISDRTDLSHFSENPVLAISIELLRSAAVPLEDRRRLLILVGTTEMEGELRIFDTASINPGSSGIAFFRPDQPIYGLIGDRFIIRLPSPATTLGGGTILDHLPRFPRRRELAELEYLAKRSTGELSDIIRSELEKNVLVQTEQLLENANFAARDVKTEAARMSTLGETGQFGQWTYLTSGLESGVGRLMERLSTFLLDKSHVKGLTLDELLSLSPFPRATSEALIDFLISKGQLVKLGDKFNLAGRGMTLKGVVKEAHDKILVQLTRERYAPPALSALASQGKPYQEAIKYIVDSGEGHKCGPEFIFLAEVWQEITAYIGERLKTQHALAVADLKDRFGFSRKYAIPILEETDRIKLTRREGDIRIKGDRFEEQGSLS